jgi:hypothetical protein
MAKLPELILALGCGVNSVAILALKKLHKLPEGIDFKVAIVALTGTEKPTTDEYLKEVITPLCREIGVDLVLVKSPIAPSLYDYYFNKKCIPTRIHRDCTDKFKLIPMRKYCKQRFGKEGFIFILGIDAGEAHRAKTGDYYPLIDMGLNREDCKKVIRKAGLPVPDKSGCIVCPFTPPKEFKKMSNDDPESFKKAVKLEKNCKRFPEITISVKPLEVLAHKEEGNGVLCDWMDRCVYCE